MLIKNSEGEVKAGQFAFAQEGEVKVYGLVTELSDKHVVLISTEGEHTFDVEGDVVIGRYRVRKPELKEAILAKRDELLASALRAVEAEATQTVAEETNVASSASNEAETSVEQATPAPQMKSSKFDRMMELARSGVGRTAALATFDAEFGTAGKHTGSMYWSKATRQLKG